MWVDAVRTGRQWPVADESYVVILLGKAHTLPAELARTAQAVLAAAQRRKSGMHFAAAWYFIFGWCPNQCSGNLGIVRPGFCATGVAGVCCSQLMTIVWSYVCSQPVEPVPFVSSMSGAGLTAMFGVTETDNSGLLALTAVCNLLLLAPVPLLLWMPPGSGTLCTAGRAGPHWGASIRMPDCGAAVDGGPGCMTSVVPAPNCGTSSSGKQAGSGEVVLELGDTDADVVAITACSVHGQAGALRS
jgi:hypothetical protein